MSNLDITIKMEGREIKVEYKFEGKDLIVLTVDGLTFDKFRIRQQDAIEEKILLALNEADWKTPGGLDIINWSEMI